MTTPSIRLHDVEVDGRRLDLSVDGGRLTTATTGESERSFTGAGGAALPGLHDHHLHLLAMAARRTSLLLGPPAVTSAASFDDTVRRFHRDNEPGMWLRGVDHEDEVAGTVDRARLDRLAPSRPVRVQHHSGALWTLSSAALASVGLDGSDALPDGVEVDGDGRPTGRLWRLDGWLRERLPATPPDLGPVGRDLAAWGITGVTDATPSTDPVGFDLLAGAVRDGSLPLDVTVTGGPDLADVTPPSPLHRGPVKLVVADHAPLDVDALAAGIAAAHTSRRPVAIHCVTRAAAAVAVAAWTMAGTSPGDRMEHASVVDHALAARLAERGITVVTQPGFVRSRGHHYLAHVDAADHADLYRCASLLAAGVRVGGSSDAPHGDPNPWLGIAAAIDRLTETGRHLGIKEAIPAPRALALYLGRAHDPGGPPRRVEVGAVADLCVLDRSLAAALADPSSVTVLLTMRRGVITHLAEESLLR
jgi:predicted amidohydrolase YtcJ